jgi:uncharacterized protein YraI
MVIVLILVNYLIFSQLFSRITNRSPRLAAATRTPEATFTPSPTLVPQLIQSAATPSPTIGPPTPTATLVNPSEEQATAATATVAAATEAAAVLETAQSLSATATPTPETVENPPLVTASGTNVNLRTGPGTDYPAIGFLADGDSLPIIGRSADSGWWQVATDSGSLWIAASVTTATNTEGVDIPVVEAPAPPQSNAAPAPANTPVPAAPTVPPPPPQPQAQYTIHNIFGQVNEAITQVRGNIRDSGGNPVNGIRVRVRSGSFCTVSYPSGPPGGYPNGNYDVLLDNRAKEGQWQVAIVDGPADTEDNSCNGSLNVLSEEVSVPTNTREGVVFVEWTKNF